MLFSLSYYMDGYSWQNQFGVVDHNTHIYLLSWIGFSFLVYHSVYKWKHFDFQTLL